MSRIEFFWRKAKLVAMAAAMWMAVYGHALAAGKGKKPAPVADAGGGAAESTHGWVLPYFILLLAVGLGMLVVCRSSRRSDRAKPKQYEGLDTSGK
jgi:hypothetical protein